MVLPIGKARSLLKQTSRGVSKKKRFAFETRRNSQQNQRGDVRSWVPQREEHVQRRANDAEQQPDKPRSERQSGHLRIVRVGYGRANLWVRRIFQFTLFIVHDVALTADPGVRR